MAMDRTGPPDDQDPEKKDSAPEAADRPEDNPFAKSDQDLRASATEMASLIQADQAEDPRYWRGKPSESATQEHEPPQDRKRENETETASRRIDELKHEGHGPQRHVEVNERNLDDRLGAAEHDQNGDVRYRNDGHVKKQRGSQIDPATGTSTDADTGGLHYCGPYATRFKHPADYVHADDVLRKRAEDTGEFDQFEAISSLFPDGDVNDRFTGRYQDPAGPENSDGSPRFKDVDFAGGKIRAIYVESDDGSPILKTMYPDPDHSRNK